MEGSATSGQMLRVVIPEAFADQFVRALTVPATVVPAPSDRDDDIAPLLREADVLISPRFTPALRDVARKLRLIQTVGAGTDQIDFRAVPGTATVCNVYGHEVGIAEYALMTMLALNRDLIGMDKRLRQGDWSDHDYGRPQRELSGRTVAVIGLGHIGGEVARYAARFGMRVIAIARTPDPMRAEWASVSYLGGPADLLSVLAAAEFVVVAVPLAAETVDFIAEREFAAMKEDAILINVARGGVVKEEALYRALRDRTIAGAAIDVWYRYQTGAERCPPAHYPFDALTNVIMTPHVAGWTEGTVKKRWVAINENLRRLGSGEPLLNVVTSTRSPS